MREPFYLAPEPEPVTPLPDPIVRRSWVGSVWELGRDAAGAVWMHFTRKENRE